MTQRIVTVFGGTGFLGREVVRQLISTGARVRVAVRNPHKANIQHINADIEYQRVDVRDKATVATVMQDADAAINAVSLYVEERGTSFNDIHIDAAEHIARLAAQNRTALVHISGLGVSTTSPSRYVRARALGEEAVRSVYPDTITLRPSVMFGPQDAFLSTLESISRLPVIPLFGQGNTKLQPVHMEDVAMAAVRVLERPKAPGKIYALGGPQVYHYREIVKAVLKSNQRSRPLLPVPFPIWKLLATTMSVLPNPPLTRDQVILMQEDNIAGQALDGFAALGIEPRSLEAALNLPDN